MISIDRFALMLTVAAALPCISIASPAYAADVAPPVAVKPGTGDWDRLLGSYQLAPTAVLAITRDGEHLFAQLSGQSKFEIFPTSSSEFFYKVVDARISFRFDDRGEATALVLHQNGFDRPAPRIDAESAKRLGASLAAKVRAQTATPGSEAALRGLIEGIRSGHPDFAAMSPELAKATREQLPALQPSLATLGTVQTVAFQGVGNQGWDIYFVKHEHGSSQWRIALAPNGIITGALVTAGP